MGVYPPSSNIILSIKKKYSRPFSWVKRFGQEIPRTCLYINWETAHFIQLIYSPVY